MKSILMANPEIVFRQEFDDWAVLFGPDSGGTFGLDFVSAFIWKKFAEGKYRIEELFYCSWKRM